MAPELKIAIPAGPSVWICGDCHVGNLRPIASAKGRIDIQIRDLDQTVIGNPAHDLIRLALSLASAARGSNLPGVTTANMIEQMVEGYEASLLALDEDAPVEEPPIIATIRRQALGRKWHHLATERIRDVKPSIPKGEKFWELDDETRWNIGVLLDKPEVKSLILTFNKKRRDEEQVKLVDAAYCLKGCSSLGKLRYAALIRIGGHRRSKLCLIDVKEVVESAAPSAEDLTMPAHLGERVTEDARALSPNLGDRMAAADISSKPVFVRELLPEDMKLDLEQFTRKEAVGAARYLSGVIGKAHGRQMATDERRAWLKELTVGIPMISRRRPGFGTPWPHYSSSMKKLTWHTTVHIFHRLRKLLERDDQKRTLQRSAVGQVATLSLARAPRASEVSSLHIVL